MEKEDHLKNDLFNKIDFLNIDNDSEDTDRDSDSFRSIEYSNCSTANQVNIISNSEYSINKEGKENNTCSQSCTATNYSYNTKTKTEYYKALIDDIFNREFERLKTSIGDKDFDDYKRKLIYSLFSRPEARIRFLNTRKKIQQFKTNDLHLNLNNNKDLFTVYPITEDVHINYEIPKNNYFQEENLVNIINKDKITVLNFGSYS